MKCVVWFITGNISVLGYPAIGGGRGNFEIRVMKWKGFVWYELWLKVASYSMMPHWQAIYMYICNTVPLIDEQVAYNSVWMFIDADD